MQGGVTERLIPPLLPDGTLPGTASVTEDLGSTLDGNLLDVDVDLDAEADPGRDR